MSENDEELFARLGGVEGVAKLVEDLYDRVFRDPQLAPFFEGVDPEHLHRMQYQFMASAFDGPVEYTGADLIRIHAGRGITEVHFARFCNHFLAAMEAAGISAADIDNALGRVAMYKDQITGETNVDG